MRLKDPGEYQSIVDAEWNIIYDKLDKCVASGASIVLSRLAIGDLATQVTLHPLNLKSGTSSSLVPPVRRGTSGRKWKEVVGASDPPSCSPVFRWQYFADRRIFCAGRVADEDLQRVAKATGGAVQTSVNNLVPEASGAEEQMGRKGS